MSDSVRPHRWEPTRLPHPWNSQGKNTGVCCHFPLQCTKVKRESEITQSCLSPSDPVDCSLPGSSVHGILQARVLEWVAIAFSKVTCKCLQSQMFALSITKLPINVCSWDCVLITIPISMTYWIIKSDLNLLFTE